MQVNTEHNMALTTKQVLNWMNENKSVQRHLLPDGHTGIVASRSYLVRQIQAFLETGSFPTLDEDRYRLCLVPLLFQEANYEDFDWSTKEGDLGQLQSLFQLDFMVQAEGLERENSTEVQYEEYRRSCDKFAAPTLS